MRFGKIKIENKELRFSKMMKSYLLPCQDIRWAYARRENSGEKHYVRVLTKMKKQYQFEMTEEETKACLNYLKECNRDLIVGFPKGAPLQLESLFNTRDLGGLKTNDGGHILPYQLLRSGDLYHLSSSDRQILLEEYHVKTIIDFRTEEEQIRKPDTPMEGVLMYSNPVLEQQMLGISREKNPLELLETLPDDPETFMVNGYQKMVLDKNCQYQYAKFFESLIQNEPGHAVLWHCSAGKDRCGIATMLLLFALDVPRGAVIDDYLRTNICLSKELEYLERLMQSKNMEKQDIEKMKTVLSAREVYLQSALNSIESQYGTIDRYLRKAMCLTKGNRKKLKDRYLV